MNRLTFASVLQVAAVPAAAGLLIGMLGRHHWLFDLFAYLRAQYVVVLVICGVLCLLLNCLKLAGINLVVALMAGWTLLPLSVSSESSNGFGLKVISYNVSTGNDWHLDVRNFLISENADVVFLMETDDRWAAELRPLEELYPYRLESPGKVNFGLTLLSKFPFSKQEIVFFENELPGAEVTIQKDSHTYHILGIHAIPPGSWANTNSRKRHFSDAAQRSANAPTPHRLLLGDLNLTPYSYLFADLLRQSNLQSIAPGYDPTWVRGSVFAMPIDHVLTSPSLQVLSRKVGPSLGSDHNPVIIEVAPAPK